MSSAAPTAGESAVLPGHRTAVAAPPLPGEPADGPAGARTGSRIRSWGALTVILAVAFGVRLAVSLNTPIEGDSATAGVTALQIGQGQLRLMEPNAHYQGTGLMFLLAPFVGVMGATAAALAVGMSALGTAYVAAMFVFGRALRPRGAFALVLAGTAAIFPLYAISFGTHARASYGDSLIWEGLLCTCAVHIGWGRARWFHWVGAGLLAGIGLWGSFLFALPAGVLALGVAIRLRRLGVANAARGTGFAGAGLLAGFSPWLAFNLRNRFISLHTIPNNSRPRLDAIRAFHHQALPIFVGTDQRWPARLTTATITVVVLAALVARRWWSRHGLRLEAVDIVLVLLPVMVAAVTMTRFNGIPAEPRYFLPAAVPLCVCVALALTSRRPLQLLSGAALGAIVLTSVFTVVADIRTPVYGTIFGAPFTPSWGDLTPWLEAQHVEALYADYWIERPLQYLTGNRIPMAPYDGYLAFPDEARAAGAVDHPSYLFAVADWPARQKVEAAIARHDIRFTTATHGQFILYTLRTPLPPGQVGGIGAG